jgi:predicted nucleotidyltransferase
MDTIFSNIKDKLVEDLKKNFKEQLDKVIVYGSYARSEEQKESDIDLIVLVNKKDDELRSYEKIIDELSIKYDLSYMIVLSITVKSSSHFYKYENILPFYSSIVKEGIEIYG